MNKANLKLNRAVNFRTNEDLYYAFALKCKLGKQKIGDRLNALIIADLKASAPVYAIVEVQPVNENTENILESGHGDVETEA